MAPVIRSRRSSRHCCDSIRGGRVPSLRAKRSNPSFRTRGDNGLLRFARNDVAPTEYDFSFSRRDTPEVCLILVSQREEGAGNAGCLLHPRSRVQRCAKKTHTSIQVQSEQSGIPCAMALRLMPCSPRRRIRLVTVVSGLMACLSPVGPTCLRGLGASNGRQDHTVLPYAIASFVLRTVNRSRVDLAPRPPCAPTLSRPPHPIPRFVTTRDPPSCRVGTGRK